MKQHFYGKFALGVVCECEHTAHTEHTRTPAGKVSHPYGARFDVNFTQQVSTIFGTFTVCKHCAVDCRLGSAKLKGKLA